LMIFIGTSFFKEMLRQSLKRLPYVNEELFNK